MKAPYKEMKKKFPFLTREEYKAAEIAELPKKRGTATKKIAKPKKPMTNEQLGKMLTKTLGKKLFAARPF